MRVLHISYSLSDESAATRIAKSLDGEVESLFYLGRKSKSDWVSERTIYTIFGQLVGMLFHVCNILLSRIFLINKTAIFSFSMFSFFQRFIVKKIVKDYDIDFVFLHWGGFGFFSPNSIDSKTNNVVILHDYYQVTAGCHIPMGCDNFHKGCDDCPLIRSKFRRFFSTNKKESKFIALSSYTKEYLGNEFDVTTIGNPLSYKLQQLNLRDQISNYIESVVNECYELSFVSLWDLEIDNKGFDATKKIILELEKYSTLNHVHIVVNLISGTYLNSNIIEIKHHEYCGEESVINLMSRSDLVLLPSKYETFSQVCLESISCGTPVVAFDLTGPRDIIIDGKTGILVKFMDVDAFTSQVIANLDFKRVSISNHISYFQETRERFSQMAIKKQYNEFLNDRF
jgi:glycosyltransferase involved in cell wall biosynthesis